MGGAPLTGANGFAGEIGHALVNSSGGECHCGRRGCLETEVRQAPLLAALKLGSTDIEKLDSTLLAQFQRDGGPDPELAALVHHQVDFLAEALSSVVNIFNPELIILGGFLGTLYATDPARMEEAVAAKAMHGPREDVRFARASMGLDLLLVGAAQQAFAAVLADPASFAEPVSLLG